MSPSHELLAKEMKPDLKIVEKWFYRIVFNDLSTWWTQFIQARPQNYPSVNGSDPENQTSSWHHLSLDRPLKENTENNGGGGEGAMDHVGGTKLSSSSFHSIDLYPVQSKRRWLYQSSGGEGGYSSSTGPDEIHSQVTFGCSLVPSKRNTVSIVSVLKSWKSVTVNWFAEPVGPIGHSIGGFRQLNFTDINTNSRPRLYESDYYQ